MDLRPSNSKDAIASMTKRSDISFVCCSVPLDSISLGIPAVGTGIFNFPTRQTVQSIIQTVLIYLNEHKCTTKIRRVVFFDQSPDKAQAFAASLIELSKMTVAPYDAPEILEVTVMVCVCR